MHIIALSERSATEPVETYSLPFTPMGKQQGFLEVTASPSAILSIRHIQKPLPVTASRFHPEFDRRLADYLAGDAVTDWKLAVALPDQPYLLACWRALAQVPYGHTITYSELADRAGNAKAVRAAASACARNPVPLLIPCHRIVAKNGTLGGFGWGLPVKQALLEMEAHTLVTQKAA